MPGAAALAYLSVARVELAAPVATSEVGRHKSGLEEESRDGNEDCGELHVDGVRVESELDLLTWSIAIAVCEFGL